MYMRLRRVEKKVVFARLQDFVQFIVIFFIFFISIFFIQLH